MSANDEDMPRANTGLAYQSGPYAYKTPTQKSVDPGMKQPPSQMSKEFQRDYNAPDELGGY